MKMPVTWRSTAGTVTNNWAAIPLLECPSAISASTSCSRGVSSSSALWVRTRPIIRGDDVRVQRRSAIRDAPHGIDEQVGVRHLLLEQVAGALGAGGDEIEGVLVVQELGEHEHADLRMGGADRERRLQPVIGVGRWHLDVGEHQVGEVFVGHPHEFGRIVDGRDHVDAGGLEHPHDAFAREGVVFADDNADGCIHQRESNERRPRPTDLDRSRALAPTSDDELGDAEVDQPGGAHRDGARQLMQWIRR